MRITQGKVEQFVPHKHLELVKKETKQVPTYDKSSNRNKNPAEDAAYDNQLENCNLGENKLEEDINQNVTLNEDQLGEIAADAGKSKKQEKESIEAIIQKGGGKYMQ